jgi:putative endonuclease
MRNRHRAERRGRIGETTAALWLNFQGWSIIARRVRTAVGEIDLVARRGGTLLFVEV